jgi:hypothetical protein
MERQERPAGRVNPEGMAVFNSILESAGGEIIRGLYNYRTTAPRGSIPPHFRGDYRPGR